MLRQARAAGFTCRRLNAIVRPQGQAGIMSQEKMALSVGAPYVPPLQSDKAGVAIGTLRIAPLNALRHPPGVDTSGWYIWGGEQLSQEPDFFVPVHHAHLAEYCPEIVPYLGLGPGWRVLLGRNQVETWFDAKLLAV
jgi:hypothetical protein